MAFPALPYAGLQALWVVARTFDVIVLTGRARGLSPSCPCPQVVLASMPVLLAVFTAHDGLCNLHTDMNRLVRLLFFKVPKRAHRPPSYYLPLGSSVWSAFSENFYKFFSSISRSFSSAFSCLRRSVVLAICNASLTCRSVFSKK